MPQVIPNFADFETRKRLTSAALRGFMKLAIEWKLTISESCALVGGISGRTWRRINSGEWRGTLTEENLNRLSALIGIYKGLHQTYSKPLADEWVQRVNVGPLYCGQRPLDVMISGGLPAIIDTRRLVDALRSGN